jgi:hypothetical protein
LGDAFKKLANSKQPIYISVVPLEVLGGEKRPAADLDMASVDSGAILVFVVIVRISKEA